MPHFTLIPLDNDDETRQPNGWRVFAAMPSFHPPQSLWFLLSESAN